VRIGVGVYTQMNRNYKHVGGRDIESCDILKFQSVVMNME